MTLVVDASVVAEALTAVGPAAGWAEGLLAKGDLAAPHLVHVEVTHVLRRLVATRTISDADATLARARLGELPIELYPYRSFADRVWDLRENVTPYDAWYVALAEALDAELATLDVRLTAASGPRCRFLIPPAG